MTENLFSKKLSQAVYNPQLSNQIAGLTGWQFANRIIAYAIQMILVIGAVGFSFMLLLGGISYITSSGDKQAVQDARRKITYAFVGLAILFSTFAFIKIVNTIFGVDIGNLGSI
jgi:predicted small integral membrane protein